MTALLHESTPAASLLQEYLDFAVELATEAGARSLGHFRQIEARRKDDGTLVTAADEEADRFISERIGARYPDHAVLSEEQCTVYDPAVDFTWVVDPIDGTTNFARGMIIWGVSIGLLYQGYPLVGVLHMPLLAETYTAAVGMGAHRNGMPIHSALETEPGDQHLLMLCTRTAKQLQPQTPLKSRMLGSAAYHLVKVAEGSALAGLESTPKVWDLAAGAVILAEAGALLSLMDGGDVFPLPPEKRDYETQAFPIMTAANSGMRLHVVGSIEK